MIYNPKEFSVEEVKSLLSAVKEDSADTVDALEELVYDLQQIRAHCTYLITQCDNRVEELQLTEDEADEE